MRKSVAIGAVLLISSTATGVVFRKQVAGILCLDFAVRSELEALKRYDATLSDAETVAGSLPRYSLQLQISRLQQLKESLPSARLPAGACCRREGTR